jgi:hypothetical protein
MFERFKRDGPEEAPSPSDPLTALGFRSKPGPWCVRALNPMSVGRRKS